MSIRGGGIVNSNACGMGNKLFQFVTMLLYADKHDLHVRGGVNKKFEKYIKFDANKIHKISSLDEKLKKQLLNSGSYDKDSDDLLGKYSLLLLTPIIIYEHHSFINIIILLNY